jgi:hypothetical protein
MPTGRTERVASERGGSSPVTGVPVTSPPQPAPASPGRGPYGGEPPDYAAYQYGYPPFSGRMFGSGN